MGSEGLGECCYEYRKVWGCCCCFLPSLIVTIISMSFDTITPTEYGLLKNTMTGEVNFDTVYVNGRHMVGPLQRFLRFPAERKTLSYGNQSRDSQIAIPARTGADSGSGASSGGQPVSLSVSFQYRLIRERIPDLFQTFGEMWESNYLRFCQQAITNVAQQKTPRMFWENRHEIELALHAAVNATLIAQGFATVPALQLRSVGFQRSYENTITNIQLQDQLRVTKSYQLEVTRVLKDVDLMQSESDALILDTNADAARQRDIILGQANANALQREQQAKSDMYKMLRSHLGWSTGDFLQYVKMKAINSQPTSNVVVGVNSLGSVPPS